MICSGVYFLWPFSSSSRNSVSLFSTGTKFASHVTITAQITTLVRAWEWSSDDRILLSLPLHHIHGIINVVSCALWSGATCEMLPRFAANAVWERIASGSLTLFMAVHTVYARECLNKCVVLAAEA